MEESDAKVLQNAQTGLNIPAEAVNTSAEGNQAIPPTDVNDSLKRQATELNTEYEVQKKKLKMDNLTQQELKRNEAVSKEIKIMTDRKTFVPDFEETSRERKIDTLMEQVRTLEAEMEMRNNDSVEVRENTREAEVALQRVEGELRILRGLVYSSEREVEDLKVNGNSRLAAFGAQMPKIAEEIRKCKGFTKMPIGPLGAHITMVDGADEKLARAVEGELGALVVSFLCDNSGDQRTLYNLFQKMQLRSIPPIFTCNFTDVKYNIATSKVQHGRYQTLMDCVDIADANVFNRLVDLCSLQRVLFIPTEAEAQRLLSKVTTVPKNLLHANVPNYQYYPAPNYRSYFKQDQTRGVLKESLKVTIAKREKQLVSEKAAVARVEPKVEEANARRRKLEKKIREQVEQVKGVEDQLKLVKGQICELKNKEARRHTAVQKDYLCDDCRYCREEKKGFCWEGKSGFKLFRYVTAYHVGRMVAKRIRCSCHPCKLNRCRIGSLLIKNLPQVKGSG